MLGYLSKAVFVIFLALLPPVPAAAHSEPPTLVIAGPGINSDGGVLFYHVQQMFGMAGKGYKPTSVTFDGDTARVRGRAPLGAKRNHYRAIRGAARRVGEIAAESPKSMLRLDMDLLGFAVLVDKGSAGIAHRLSGPRLGKKRGALLDKLRTRWNEETERASAFIEEAAREFKKKHPNGKVVVVGHSAFTNAVDLTPLDDPRTGKPLIDFRVLSSPMVRKMKYQDAVRTMIVTHESDLPPANMGNIHSPLSTTDQDLTWTGTVLHLKGKTIDWIDAHSRTQHYRSVFDMEIRTIGGKQDFRGTPAEVILKNKDAVFQGKKKPHRVLINTLKSLAPIESRVGGITLTKPADLSLDPAPIVDLDIGTVSDWPQLNYGSRGIIELPRDIEPATAAAAMACVYLDRPPELSLSPGTLPDGGQVTGVDYICQHLAWTRLGDMMREADRILGALALGGPDSRRLANALPGFHPFAEIALDHETFWDGTLGLRVWVVPARLPLTAEKGRLRAERSTMAVRLEFYPIDKQREYFDDNADVGISGSAGDFIAARLTADYHTLAAAYPVLADLTRAAEFVGALIWARRNGIELSDRSRRWMERHYRRDLNTNLYTNHTRDLKHIGGQVFDVLPFEEFERPDPATIPKPLIVFNQFGVSRMLWPDGGTSVVKYAANGLVEGVKNRNGERVHFLRDETGRLAAITEASGQGISILWDRELAAAVFWADIDAKRLQFTVGGEARLMPVADPRTLVREWLGAWINAEIEGGDGRFNRQRLKSLGTTLSWIRWSYDWWQLALTVLAAALFAILLHYRT